MSRCAALALVAWTGAAGAEGLPGPRLGAAAFEAETAGLTIRYEVDGVPHGAEQYLPGREVIWQDVNGDCRRGIWAEAGGAFCFLYEDRPDWTCWDVWRGEGGAIEARVLGAPEGAPVLRSAGASERPLVCEDLDVGS